MSTSGDTSGVKYDTRKIAVYGPQERGRRPTPAFGVVQTPDESDYGNQRGTDSRDAG